MLITHTISKADGSTKLTTELDPTVEAVDSEGNLYHTADLTRIINSKIHSISMRHKTSLSDLYRLTILDNETFELMAYLQKKEENKCPSTK